MTTMMMMVMKKRSPAEKEMSLWHSHKKRKAPWLHWRKIRGELPQRLSNTERGEFRSVKTLRLPKCLLSLDCSILRSRYLIPLRIRMSTQVLFSELYKQEAAFQSFRKSEFYSAKFDLIEQRSITNRIIIHVVSNVNIQQKQAIIVKIPFKKVIKDLGAMSKKQQGRHEEEKDEEEKDQHDVEG